MIKRYGNAGGAESSRAEKALPQSFRDAAISAFTRVFDALRRRPGIRIHRDFRFRIPADAGEPQKINALSP
jgi:hypothetical protein